MTNFMRHFSSYFDRALPFLLLAAALVPFVVILQHSNELAAYWQKNVALDLGRWVLICIAIATVLRLCMPRQAGPVLTAIVATVFIMATGLLPTLSVLLFALACTLLGMSMLRLLVPLLSQTGSLLPAFFTGLALYLGLFSVMAHFRVNYRMVMLALLLLPVVITALTGKFHRVTSMAVVLAKAWSDGLQKISWPLLVLMTVVLGYVASHAFLPTMGSDDQSLHLRLWTELAWQHKALFDFRSNVWALAPMLVDLQHAIVSMVAGSDARASLTLFWSSLLLIQFWQLAQQHLKHAGSTVLLLLLFVSTPMLGNLLITLQTELFMALLVISGVHMILSSTLRWYSAEAIALLAIAALCCGTKLTGALLGVLVLIAAVVQVKSSHSVSARPGKLQWFALAGYLLLLAVPAFISYLHAWRAAGNPLFPLYNAVFRSPYIDSSSNFSDARWISGFSLKSYWDVFFATNLHYESMNFVAGFQYLLLLPLACIKALSGSSRRQWLLVLVPLAGFGLLMFANLQYWRYLFPVLPLASLLLLVLLQTGQAPRPQLSRWVASFAMGAALVLNLYFYPGITWIFQLSPLDAMSEGRRAMILEKYATPAAINERLNIASPGLRVLYPPETGYGATLNGEPVYATWVSPATVARAMNITNASDVADFLHEEKVDLVIWSLSEPIPAGSIISLLDQHLSRYGFPEFQLGSHIVYRLLEQELPYRPLFSLSEWNASQSAPAAAFVATGTPRPLAQINTHRARVARYTVSYLCNSSTGYFVAQLNWDNGNPYYRLLPCAETEVTYSEAVPIPAGADGATIYLTSRDRSELLVNALTVEIL